MVWIITLIVIVLFAILIATIFAVQKRNDIKQIFTNIKIEQIDAIDGTEFEEVVCLMMKYNFWKAKVTSKSHDYGCDIVAKRLFKQIIVQTKLYYNHKVGLSAVQQICTAKKHYGIKHACVVTNWHFSSSAIKLAKENNITLINRNDIIKFLNKINKTN